MENIKKILKEELKEVEVDKIELTSIEKKLAKIKKEITFNIRKNKIKADIIIGGSYAKGTLIKKKKYDIDLFIRFDRNIEEDKISDLLKKLVPKNSEKIHGSRDYYRLKENYERFSIEFEIIPVIKINRNSEARNTTDLSYSHVWYVNGKIKKNKKLASEIKLAKAFLHYQGCYGAESFINGFSGYATELIIIYYKSFINFLKAMSKLKVEEKLIIDTEGFYKNRREVLTEINEAKLQSPIILIDPTYNTRNALAALNMETLLKLKKSSSEFLKKPSLNFFKHSDKIEAFKKRNKKFVELEARIDRQPGDIAGTKLRKFYNQLIDGMRRYFDVKDSEFFYDEDRNIGKIMLNFKEKKKLIFSGPPLEMKENCRRFRLEHKNVKIKNKKLYAVEKNINFKEFLSKIILQRQNQVRVMLP
jgi:tRNA nucleotidyltransferase (CCA-adding enzyme)